MNTLRLAGGVFSTLDIDLETMTLLDDIVSDACDEMDKYCRCDQCNGEEFHGGKPKWLAVKDINTVTQRTIEVVMDQGVKAQIESVSSAD